MKHTRWLAVIFVLALAAGLLSAAYFITPGVRRPSLAQGDILVCTEADGSLVLSWPDAGEDSVYLVELHSEGRDLRQHTERPSVVLSGVTPPFRVRVQATASGTNLMGMPRELTSLTHLDAEVSSVSSLTAPALRTEAEEGGMTFSWEGGQSSLYAVCSMQGGVYLPVVSSSGTGTYLRFDGGGGPELPAYGEPLYLALRAGTSGAGYVLYGPPSEAVAVERGDLLGDALNLTVQEGEPRMYALEWTEARGGNYELREWRDGAWAVLDQPEPQERFRYDLGRLPSGSFHRYQVLTRDGGGHRQLEEEVSFYASVTPLYCTVWPIIDLDVYNAPGEGGTLGRVTAGTALCVLAEEGRWFRVRYQDRYGYVDSRYCMINLPEYIGDYCAYDITNSYASIFQVHDNPIASITGQVIPGFEHVNTAEEGYLVPYLYPCAQKLLSAAKAAVEDGYRLKIYEAFRPNEATRFLYDTTAAKLGDPALVLDGEKNAVDPVSGWQVELSTGYLIDPETGEAIDPVELLEEEEGGETEEGGDTEPPGEDRELPEDGVDGEGWAEEPEFRPLPPEEQPPEDETGLQEDGGDEETPERQTETPDEGESPEEAGDGGESYPTYGSIMTDNGRFRLGSFLAAVTSAHNRGIALDLTLETLDTARELKMQSAIHDLSWYSAVYRNNENAGLLASYLTGAGMRGLSSEWWHFQDDETREAIGLTSYLYKGVNMSGWTRDDRGWRLRDADGRYIRGAAVTVDGTRYTLDREGYAGEVPPE